MSLDCCSYFFLPFYTLNASLNFKICCTIYKEQKNGKKTRKKISEGRWKIVLFLFLADLADLVEEEKVLMATFGLGWGKKYFLGLTWTLSIRFFVLIAIWWHFWGYIILDQFLECICWTIWAETFKISLLRN